MSLPEYRKALHGRTWPEATHNAGWAGTVYRRSRVADVLCAVCIGGTLALVAFYGLSGGWR